MDSCHRLAPELLKLTANSLTLSKPPNPLPPSLPTLSPLSYCKNPARPLIHAGDYYRAQRSQLCNYGGRMISIILSPQFQ